MNTIKRMLGSDHPFGIEAEELWKEYASDSTPEANFVKDLDKLELIIQAIEYENSKNDSVAHKRVLTYFLYSFTNKGREFALRNGSWLVKIKLDILN